jgi:lipid-binding SYLF domain-containing protein
MRTQSWYARLAILTLSCVMSFSVVAAERQDARLVTSTQVLTELLQMPEQNIPTWLLERAHAVAVIPAVIKVGLGIGGRRGKGVLVVRKDSGAWSNPIFVNLTGGSFGFQVGVQSTDVVLVFTSRQSIEGIVGGKVTLGADASVAAGPVGRQSSAATDIGLTAQVYSYSRASGLFADHPQRRARGAGVGPAVRCGRANLCNRNAAARRPAACGFGRGRRADAAAGPACDRRRADDVSDGRPGAGAGAAAVEGSTACAACSTGRRSARDRRPAPRSRTRWRPGS